MRDVAFSCDDRGTPYLNVAVWSLLDRYAGAEPLRVNVLEGCGGHSPAAKAALAEIVGRFPKASLRYVNVDSALAPYAELLKPRPGSRWNVFTWTPVFVPLLLADATGNVAHFDIDMLFNADVSPLLEMDLGDNLIAAVAEYGRGDPVITEAVWGKGILPASVTRYFNTGTLVFNLEKCRTERTWEKILAWYRTHYDVADRIEQDAWNALYHDRTLLLPLKWNFHDRLMKTYPRRDPSAALWQGNPPQECLEAARAPAILHFWGPKKPWKKCHRPYRKLYHAAMRAVGQTPPRESVLAPWYNLSNALTRRRLERLATCEQREWRRRVWRHTVQDALLAPFEWLGIALAMALFVPLPRRILLTLADVVSAGYRFFDGRGRKIAHRNLAILFGDRLTPKRERVLVARSYRNMCRTIAHAFWTTFRARQRVPQAGEMSEPCRAFLAANRPAITISGHLGCWEILSQLAYLEGHAMMSVAKDIGTRGMTRLLMRSRRSIGQEIVSAEGAFKPLMAGLKAGKSLGLLVDQRVSPRKGGVWVYFFARPVPVSAAPAFFAAKAKVPLVLAWSRPLKDGRYRCEFVRKYEASVARDIWGFTQTLANDLAAVIRRHPSAWLLNYDCFSRKPGLTELATLEKRFRENFTNKSPFCYTT